MSFHNQAYWMGKSPGSLNDGDMTNDNSSRIESKRTHQWFDDPEVDMFPNKKQAVDPPNNLFSGMLNSNTSLWGNSSGFHSLNGHFTEQLFAPDAAAMNFEDANTPSVSIDDTLSVERKDTLDPFGSESSFGLSISTALEDPPLLFNYDGISKVKVNEIESKSTMSAATMNLYDSRVSDTVSNPCLFKEGDNSIPASLAYNNGIASMIGMDGAYNRTDNNFMSMSQSYNNGNDSLSIHPTFNEICNTISMDQGFDKVDSNVISAVQAYNKVHDNSVLTNHLYNEADNGTMSVPQPFLKEENDVPFVSKSYNKGESTIISFGGCDDDTDPSDLFIPNPNYDLMMCEALSHNSEAVNKKELVAPSSNILPSTVQTSAPETENVPKAKEIKVSRKATSNNFPSNVRSLLSTGMLDGLSVKYKAWSQEKELPGVIKGAGYLCSCTSCNFSKTINAYEFERHAGCKTKHPNNHIYFDNGKTIYGVVQELRSTPQSMLFQVIQTITGSPINQKSFCIWKESFLASASNSSAYVENKK